MKKEVLDHCFKANKVYEDSYKIVTVKNVLPILLEDPHRLLDPNHVNSFLLASFFAQYPDLVAFHPQWKPPSGQPANLTTLHARSSLTLYVVKYLCMYGKLNLTDFVNHQKEWVGCLTPVLSLACSRAILRRYSRADGCLLSK